MQDCQHHHPDTDYKTLLEVLLNKLERLTQLTMKIDDLNTAIDKLATDVAALPKPDPNGATEAQLDGVLSKVAAIDASIAPPPTPA